MGWFSDRIDALKKNVSNAWDSAGDKLGAAVDGVKGAGQWIGNNVSDAATWVGKTTSNTWDGAVAIVEDPKALRDSIAEALKDSMEAIKDAAVFTVNDPLEAAKIVGTTYMRTQAIMAQGVTNALTNTVGSIGDLGVMAYNLAGEAVIFTANMPVRAANMFFEEGEGFILLDHQWAKSNCAKWLTDQVQFIEPQNGFEKTMLYGTQAVGEVASFVVVTAGTAGVGGAALAVGRGAGASARLAKGVQFFNGAADDSVRLARYFGQKSSQTSGKIGQVLKTGNNAMAEATATTNAVIKKITPQSLEGVVGSGMRTGTKTMNTWLNPFENRTALIIEGAMLPVSYHFAAADGNKTGLKNSDEALQGFGRHLKALADGSDNTTFNAEENMHADQNFNHAALALSIQNEQLQNGVFVSMDDAMTMAATQMNSSPYNGATDSVITDSFNFEQLASSMHNVRAEFAHAAPQGYDIAGLHIALSKNTPAAA